MKPNINDRSSLREVKRLLTAEGVSPTAITTVEKALKRGMSFGRLEDLAILDIPSADAQALSGVVDFGPPRHVTSNIRRVEYRFVPDGDATAFFGYQFLVRYVDNDGFTTEESFPIEGDRTVIVDYDVAVIRPDSQIALRVNTASGARAGIKLHNATGTAADVIEVTAKGVANAVIEVVVGPRTKVPNPTIHSTYAVKGKVISRDADDKLSGYQVVLFAATTVTNNKPDYHPVAFARTESGGYFVTSELLFEDPEQIIAVKAAKASVSKEGFSTEVPIRLSTTGGTAGAPGRSQIPEHVILVIGDTSSAKSEDEDCGCNDLNFHEKLVLEEHSYYSVVRTSEPSIIADVLEDQREIDLQDIYGIPGRVPLGVFKKFQEIQNRQPIALKVAGLATETAVQPDAMPPVALARSTPTGSVPVRPGAIPFNQSLLDRLLVDHKVNVAIQGDDRPVFKGRTPLSQTNQVDWDDTPTIYQAASIAHGHLLHFKQEWMPDGYSIGDLVYSLPLAPGQKKQIAVLDWERRESAANSQQLDYEETLNNSLVRDRDISEVIAGTLTENLRGNSRAVTGGIGFGMGSSVMGIIPGVGSFGSLLGISGGGGLAKSTANQSATRDSTASSLQSINDRTQQAASVVRSQRATVVQTVSQGERVQATAESVANYNHCHALTIQYFEVLRHFVVRNRLAGVQECLFVPLQMTPFDIAKVLRWRNSLEKHLFRRELRAGFDAIGRIANEKESAYENYYDSIGFPRKNYAEQAIDFYTGELFMDFFFFNTNEKKIDDDIAAFYAFFGISLDGYRDKQITDAELAEHVGPRAIEYLLDCLRIETDKGTDLRLDLTLMSNFRQNAQLRISVRQSAATPTWVARDRVDAIAVKLDLSRLSPDEAHNLAQFQNKYMKIRLRSGNLRYRTANLSGSLFEGRVDNDIFAGGDGAYLPTPLSPAELRNPRGEDVNAANNLLHHLNENLEYYNKCLFFDFTPERRFMLLDGIIAPGKANGRSVASVVENRVIGIAGNSLIMPVAPGNQLDPMIDEKFDLFAQYYSGEPDPMRISMPTKGVYAEAVMGACNSCEEKDESRFWRWEESPIPDSPNTQILPLNTDTRRADPGDLQPKDFPTPVVNIQNAPSVPDPAGLSNLLQLLGKGDAFRDVTGLNQNQLNALAAYQKALDTAESFGKEAAELAKAAATVQLAKDAQRAGALPTKDTQEIVKKSLDPDEQTKTRAAEREAEREDAKKDVEVIEQSKQKDQLDDVQAKDMTEDRERKAHGTTKRPPAAPRRPGKRKINLTIYMRDIEGRPLVGSFLVFVGPISASPLGKMDITGIQPYAQFKDVEIDTRDENPINIVGDPVLTTGPNLVAIGSEFYHHAFDSLTVGASPTVVLFVQQTRKTMTLEFESVQTEQKIREHTFKVEGGYETGSLAKLLAGSISVNFGYEYKRTASTGSSTGFTHTYTVHYPARKLKLVTKGAASNEIDSDE